MVGYGRLIYPCGDLTSKIFDFTGFYRLVVSLSDSLVLWLCGSVLWLVRCLCKNWGFVVGVDASCDNLEELKSYLKCERNKWYGSKI